jgi:hypothetical protein
MYFQILAKKGLLEATMEGRFDPDEPAQLEWARSQLERFGVIRDAVPEELLTDDQKMTAKEKKKKEAEEAKKGKKAKRK